MISEAPDRFSCRLLGIIISLLTFYLISNLYLSSIIFIISIISPIIILPLNIILRFIFVKISKTLFQPTLFFIYFILIFPYGLLIKVFIKSKISTTFKNENKIKFDDS